MRTLVRGRFAGVDDAGAIAVLVAILAPVLIGIAAFSVDVARWYVEGIREQKAVDAAALAGVTYMPQDFANATATALRVAALNGYTSGVTVKQGPTPSQLQVTIAATVKNAFGVIIGVPTTTVARTSIADYQGPAPMGSPCNTFGNEPPGSTTATGTGPVSVLPAPPVNVACNTTPRFWGAVLGPDTNKLQGDQYMTRSCSSTDGCSGGANTDFDPQGYFYIVHVDPSLVGTQIEVQVYDPEYAATSQDCSGIPNFTSNTPNPYTNDALTRYDNVVNNYCSGDLSFNSSDPVQTSFALRAPTGTQDPKKSTAVSGCSAQFRGQGTAPTVAQLTSTNAGYIPDLAATFHQWFRLCTFTASVSGDYYLQVRTNVALPTGLTQVGSKKFVACSDPANPLCTVAPNGAITTQTGDDTTVGGNGDNIYAVRAKALNGSKVSIAGYQHMTIDINAGGGSTFNLIRVLPGAAGKQIQYSFYDAADGTAGISSVVVVPPSDSASAVAFPGGTISGCTASGVYTGSLSGCSVSVSSSNNGRTQHVVVPIPSNYTCDFNNVGGCWFRVKVNYSQATDVTTWTAIIVGDPVRLVK